MAIYLVFSPVSTPGCTGCISSPRFAIAGPVHCDVGKPRGSTPVKGSLCRNLELSAGDQVQKGYRMLA